MCTKVYRITDDCLAVIVGPNRARSAQVHRQCFLRTGSRAFSICLLFSEDAYLESTGHSTFLLSMRQFEISVRVDVGNLIIMCSVATGEAAFRFVEGLRFVEALQDFGEGGDADAGVQDRL